MLSNLPPGCRVSDIPGNSPEDEKWEAIESVFWNNDNNCSRELWAKFSEAKLDDDLMTIVDRAIEYGMELGRIEECEYQAEAPMLVIMEQDYKDDQIRDILEYMPMMEA